jgi:hypothetical protein
MPGTSIKRPETRRKSLPVKWRDNEWCPRITIKQADRRIRARCLQPDDADIAVRAGRLPKQTRRKAARTPLESPFPFAPIDLPLNNRVNFF